MDLDGYYPPKEFVEAVANTLREWLASPRAVSQSGVEPLTQIIKPIPTIDRGTELPEEYWSKLEGQLRMVHVRNPKCRSINIELV